MQQSGKIFIAVVIGTVIAGCSKDGAQPGELTGALVKPTRMAEPSAAEPVDPSAEPPGEAPSLVERIGVEPGAFSVDEQTPPEAVVIERQGAIGIRRVGEELWREMPPEEAIELYAGDQLRTGEDARASVLLPDNSRVELSESSAIAVGDRDGDADPASSIAVLLGVVRFEISARAEGEGPFLAFAPSGIVNALGTAFVVGVSATGSMRVGVDEGTVEVAGTADLAQPAELGAAKAVDLSAGGELSAVASLEGNWGGWRVEQEAKAEPAAVVELQIGAAQAAQAKIEAGYETLQQQAAAAVEADAEAEALMEKNDLAAYQASAEARASLVEAPFLVSLRLQQLSFAMLAHAHVAQELYLRSPDKLAAVHAKEPNLVARAVLLQKKYHVVSRARVKPLRAAYYRHHPRGRGHAKALGVALPAFFAKAKLKAAPKPPAEAGEIALYRARRPMKNDRKRRIAPEGVAHGWHAKAVEKSAKKGKDKSKGKAVGWYEIAPEARASLMLHGKPKREAEPMLGTHAPKAREQSVLAWAKRHGAHPGKRLALGHGKRAPAEAKPEAEQPAPRPAAVNPAGHELPAQAVAKGNRPAKVSKGTPTEKAAGPKIGKAVAKSAAAPGKSEKAGGPEKEDHGKRKAKPDKP